MVKGQVYAVTGIIYAKRGSWEVQFELDGRRKNFKGLVGGTCDFLTQVFARELLKLTFPKIILIIFFHIYPLLVFSPNFTGIWFSFNL
jgi:hypothetical protein